MLINKFEQLIIKLTEQTRLMSNNDRYELDEFKLSLQLIIELSDMIQATDLKDLTQTVFEFLDDDVNGNIKIPEKVFARLLLVVGFYSRYVNLFRVNWYYKAHFINRNL